MKDDIRLRHGEAVSTHIHVDIQKLFLHFAQWNKVWYRVFGYSQFGIPVLLIYEQIKGLTIFTYTHLLLKFGAQNMFATFVNLLA